MKGITKVADIYEKNAKGLPVKEAKWDVSEVATPTVRLNDPGVGDSLILRSFFFKALPRPKGMDMPKKQDIISSYKRLIDTRLWADGLVAADERPPVLYTLSELKKNQALKKKMIDEHADFVIMLLTRPRSQQFVADTARKI